MATDSEFDVMGGDWYPMWSEPGGLRPLRLHQQPMEEIVFVLPGLESGSSVETRTSSRLPTGVSGLEQIAVDFGGNGLLEKADRDDQPCGIPLPDDSSCRAGEWTAGDTNLIARGEVGVWNQRGSGDLEAPETLELGFQPIWIVDWQEVYDHPAGQREVLFFAVASHEHVAGKEREVRLDRKSTRLNSSQAR